MELLLESLSLKRFKGVEDFTLQLDGRSVTVRGKNGSGKTTLKDALTFLLFDKASDFAKLDPKTKGADGEPIHHLDHTAEAEFRLNGTENLTLKKIYKETWTKPRGQTEKVLSGHSTEHFLNGDFIGKKKDFQAAVARIATEENFRMLTSPDYFPGVMDWKKRREILMGMCEDVPNSMMFEYFPGLKPLAPILAERTVDVRRATISRERSELEKKKTGIPAVIEELQRGFALMPPGFDIGLAKADLETVKAEFERLASLRINLTEGGLVAEKNNRLTGIETELNGINNEASARIEEESAGLREKLNKLNNVLSQLSASASEKDSSLYVLQQKVSRVNGSLEGSAEAFSHHKNKKFDAPTECPTCGAKVSKKKHDGLLKMFNAAKAKRLTEINEDRAGWKVQLEDINKQVAEVEKELESLYSDQEEKTKERSKIGKELNEFSSELPADLQKKRDGLLLEQQTIREQLGDIEKTIREDIAKLDEIRFSRLADKDELQTAIDEYDNTQKNIKRVEELKAGELSLSSQIEKINGELYLLDLFERKKIGLLEDRINSKFKVARFKFFNVLLGGDVSPCCEVLYNGKTYSKDASNGEKIRVGLDIISTLQQYFGIKMPIVIDNSESVHDLPPMDCQVIRLVVDETKPALEVGF